MINTGGQDSVVSKKTWMIFGKWNFDLYVGYRAHLAKFKKNGWDNQEIPGQTRLGNKKYFLEEGNVKQFLYYYR